MSIWAVMLIGGLVTYMMRLSFIYLLGRFDIPPTLRRSLRFVPPAVLTAIVFPELMMPGGTLDISLGNARLLAGAIAVLTAWFTRNILLTILAGMAALLLLQLLG